MKIYPYEKGGGTEKVVAMPKEGHTICWLDFTR